MNKSKRAFLIAVFLLIFHSTAFAGINLSRIIAIESSGDPKAYNSSSKARGLCQITPICLKDYNNYHKIKFSTSDLFNSEINKQIAQWYLNIRIPQLLKYYNKEITIRNILISYNAGIDYVIRGRELKQETRDYIIKYERRNK